MPEKIDKFIRRLDLVLPLTLKRVKRKLRPLPFRHKTSNNISQINHIRLSENAHIDCYWLKTNLGSGPAASVYVSNDEVMRFDCLAENGHMHFNMSHATLFDNGGNARLYFQEKTVPEQIQRVLFELTHNLPYALKLNSNKKIRRTIISSTELATATKHLEIAMRALYQNSITTIQDTEA